MRVVALVLVAVGGFPASIGVLQASALSLLGALAASVATAAFKPRRVTSWIPSAVIVAAIIVVILADQIGIDTHRQGT